MARDRELQALVDRAAEVKQEEARRAAGETPEPPPPPLPPPAQRYAVYREIDRANGVGILWWLGAVVAAMVPFFVQERVVVIASGAFAALLVVRLVAGSIARRRGFARFRAFPAGIAFPVTGWSGLLTEQLAGDVEEWLLECSVIIELAPGADVPVLRAAEELFVAGARGWIYPSDSIGRAASDRRAPWTIEATDATHRLTGAANLWVAGEVYRLVCVLDRIHRRAGGVARVTVAGGGSSISASRIRSTD